MHYSSKGYNKGIILVAAAGNDDTISKFYPAGYDKVIAGIIVSQFQGRFGVKFVGYPWSMLKVQFHEFTD